MWLYQSPSENNIAKTIFLYTKNQRITMSEEQLRRRLIDISRPKTPVDCETYAAIIVDFSSWCTSFRPELSNSFAHLDALFGFDGVYTYTHHFPIESNTGVSGQVWPSLRQVKGVTDSWSHVHSGSRGVDGGSKAEGMDPSHHHYASLGGPGEEYTRISTRAGRHTHGYNKSNLRRGAGQPEAGTS